MDPTLCLFSCPLSDLGDFGDLCDLITIDRVSEWVKHNNIRQIMQVVLTILQCTSVRDVTGLEHRIIKEATTDVLVVHTVLDQIDTLCHFRASCWWLSDWRIGSVVGTTTDLYTSLRLIRCKVKLLVILRTIQSLQVTHPSGR